MGLSRMFEPFLDQRPICVMARATLERLLDASQPLWLAGYRVQVLDGNHLSATEHRLKELRSTWAAPRRAQRWSCWIRNAC